MKPYLPIGLLLSLLFVLCSNSSHAVDEAKSPLFGKRPNIVLVMTDDQGWLHLGSSGHPFLHTPRSDEFAKESLVFNDFVVSSTCAPTRAALMSGAHPFKSGVTHTIHERERMALDMTTLPEVLQSAGYRTGIFGKWHLGDEDEFLPDNRGFDEVFIHGAGGIGQCFPGSGSDIPGQKQMDLLPTSICYRLLLNWLVRNWKTK
jgi:arylsulfatase